MPKVQADALALHRTRLGNSKLFRSQEKISVSLTLAGGMGTGKDAYATWQLPQNYLDS